MSDTYTPSLRISQQAIGANENSWGTILNASLAMLEEAIAGRAAIALSGNVTLTTADNADDQARNALIDFTGSPGATCTVTMPDVEKLTWVRNDTGDASGIVIKTGAGASVSVAAGAAALIATDGAGNATAVLNVTAAAAALLGDPDATAMRATLGLGNIATHATTDFLAAANLTAHGVLIGNGTGPLDATSAGTSGQPLLSGGAGANPNWGTLGVGAGGTGLMAGTSGGVLGFTGNGTLASSGVLAANALVLGGGAGSTPSALGSLGTTSTVLHGNASGAPSFGAVNLGTDVTGTLGVGNGGTGVATLAAHGVVIGNGSGAANVTAAGSAGQALLSGGASADPNWGTLGTAFGGTGLANSDVLISDIAFVIDGGGSTITTGVKGYLGIDFPGNITQATLLGDRVGNVVVNVYKTTYTNFDAGSTHPVSGDKITSSTPPTIANTTKSQDSTLTGWTTSFSAGDVFAFNVDSVVSMQRVTVTLKVQKS